MLKSHSMKRALIPIFLFTTLLALAQSTAVDITAEPHHHLALENQYVRVFKVELAPHDQIQLHRHDHDYMFVILGDTEIENDVAGKPPATLKLKDGDTRFSSGGFSHTVKNLSATPFRNVAVEFLQDEKARKTPPPKWDEERGMHILEGGTQDILFVKDGVRVTDIQLQPGGSIPRHHHAGPHLVVSLTDYQLRSDVVGKGSKTMQQKAGDVSWVPGGFTHVLTNSGKQPARFITLEFH
jgi:quercetin dioxygenase-like cupin family protein